MHVITKTSELESFCQAIMAEKFITIDTEFSREATYYPKLCLIQIASEKQAVIIDALSPAINLSPLDLILQKPSLIKVFHSAKQDLEALYLLFKHLPQNIFDTQIAASFCGFGDSISYEALVLEFTQIQIDKSHRVSDWTKRPLSINQLEYALADVTHLRIVYLKLMELLKAKNRLAWALEEMTSLDSPANFTIDLEQAWHKIKNIRDVKVNLVLKKLASWREVKAQQHDLPRNHYLNERHIFKLVENIPITLAELKSINYFHNIDKELGEEIITIIQNALSAQIEADLNNAPRYSRNNREISAQLKLLLQLKADEYSLSPQLLATSLELKTIAGESETIKTPRCLSGWRYDIFGKFALDIKNGKFDLKEEA